MTKFRKKVVLAFLANFCFLFGSCVSACDKLDADDPKFTGGNNQSTENNTGKDENSSDVELEPGKDLYTVIIPSDLPSQEKMYTGFYLSFNKDNHTPNYVTWELTSAETYGSISRSDEFHQDPDLDGCPDDRAYRGSGYDRGHICPAADQKWSEEAMYDCFSMANMCPQLNSLNAGAWLTLENKERNWARRDGAIWIAAGPIYNDTDQKRIGTFGTRVPGAFFKAFLYYNPKNPEKSRAIAFVYPHMAAEGNMQDYVMSIDDLEAYTGYDFFSALPDEIENKVEAEYSFTEWNK